MEKVRAMTQNKIAPGALEAVLAHQTRRRGAASFSARIGAKLFSGRLDQAVENGVIATEGTALAVHIARLSSPQVRDDLARALRTVLGDAKGWHGVMTSRVPVRADAVLAVTDLIDELTLRLHAPLPVHARGMARLRLLLSDGRGPLYRCERGSLSAALRGVLAAL